MSKKNDGNGKHTHHAGCGCTPTFFMQMMEQAAQELSRREFLKGASLVGGALAMGALGGLADASENSVSGNEADVIYFGGPILTMVDEKDRPEALAVKNGKILAWPMYKGVDDALFQKTATSRHLHKRLKLGGVKLTVDGSIQGYTAYLSQPYYKRAKNILPHGDKCNGEMVEETLVTGEKSASDETAVAKSSAADVGYPSMTQEQVDGWVKRCDEHNVPLQVHTNGDAATDMLLQAVEHSRGKKPRPDLRTTIIHAQMMRDDQLDLAAKHGMTPSFFPIHVYFWGDRHRDLFLGPKRAARLNPSRSALDRGLKITLHHDAPIAGIEMLSVADAAVNRITTSGKLLGAQERITPFEALRAITADAAWQNFEEKRKGTLEAGKLADMVILSENPLTADPKKIKEIKVLETIKEGRSVYKADMPPAA